MSRQSVFISGGAGGIGLVTARMFLERGWRVGIGDVDSDALARIAAENDIETFLLDVTSPEAWSDVLGAFCGSPDGPLDVLVNNAGVLTFGWFAEQDPATFGRLVDVNVKGVLYGARAGVAHLTRSGSGRLVNIASSAGLSAAPRLAVYSATKFAVRGLSEALDIEFMRLGVRVSCIEPFIVNTTMLDSDDASGVNYRDAVKDYQILVPTDVAEEIWRSTHDTTLHHPVGDIARHQAAGLNERVQAERTRWSQIFGIDPPGA